MINIENLGKNAENINEKTNTLIVEVPLDKLETNPLNFYDEEFNLEDLKTSIDNVGQIEPLMITSKYRIISGHRRYKALTALNKPYALCIIKSDIDYLDEELLLISANKQRIKTKSERDLEIQRLDELYKEKKEADPNFKININEQIANDLGISKRTVARAKSLDNETTSDESKFDKCINQLVKSLDKCIKFEDEFDEFTLNKIIELKKNLS